MVLTGNEDTKLTVLNIVEKIGKTQINSLYICQVLIKYLIK